MFKIMKVTGESLSPVYKQGDYVLLLTATWWLKRLEPGDVVVFRHPQYGVLIKKVSHCDQASDKIEVTGTHPLSVDSRQFGPVPRSWVIGKVLWHFRKPSSE